MEVGLAAGEDLDAPLNLLESSVREGEPVPPAFAGLLREEMERGDIEVLAASVDGAVVGVALLAFRPSISAGGRFASVEELYVEPEFRRRGVGRALLAAAEDRCRCRSVSYVEVQGVEDEAVAFYKAVGYEVEDEVRVLSRSVAPGGSRPENC